MGGMMSGANMRMAASSRRRSHVVNVSGGKDSTAVYLLALESGRPFRAVFADTGHEHPLTYAFIDSLSAATGGPAVEVVRADFTKDFKRKREYILNHWPADGVPQDRVDMAADLLMHPTGIPMLDLCMLKGRFPSSQSRFCTEELKVLPMLRAVIAPLASEGQVLQWLGVRADESAARAKLPRFSRGDFPRVYYYRPLLNWTADDVFAMHRRHGLEPNPLYKLGAGRVGCTPCIFARKAEINILARRFPEEFERVERWERLVAETSKAAQATMFSRGKVKPMPPDGSSPGIWDVVRWAETARGGRELDPDAAGPLPACSSIYGLCE